MMYIHTWATSSVDLFVAIVAISHMKLLQFSSDMISSSRIGVPESVYQFVSTWATSSVDLCHLSESQAIPCPKLSLSMLNVIQLFRISVPTN
jgi:hypothetical protein